MHDHQKLEAIQEGPSTGERISKQVFPHKGTLLNSKMEQTADKCNNMDEFQIHRISERSVFRRSILYDFIYMMFPIMAKS